MGGDQLRRVEFREFPDKDHDSVIAAALSGSIQFS